MNEYLIADPAIRRARANEKEIAVLTFLRDEVYSSTTILAVEMGVGDRAARNVLNRMAERGLLVKDKVKFIGGRALPLWGITSSGVLEGLTPNEIATVNLRCHRAGSVSSVTIAHTLDVQKCRQYLHSNPEFFGWTPTRRLPAHNKNKSHSERWAVYPDGVISEFCNEKGVLPVAIEVERSRKTPQRYVQIIKGHLNNIEDGKYFNVYYFCTSLESATSLQALFLRLMKDKDIGYWIIDKDRKEKLSPEDTMGLFTFRSMGDF
tara:strand:+ start:9469 stop:10257 length:789 start_codon:yes stop_codon:yes gene_type:complete